MNQMGTEVGHEDCELLLLASNALGKIAVNRTESNCGCWNSETVGTFGEACLR
jgi:hypothetical protein